MADTRFGRRDPDARGYYGEYGGKFVPETLVAPVEELQQAYFDARQDEAFLAELDRLLAHYVGRPTPIYETTRLRASIGKAGRQNFPEARRPRAHRRAQDQQRARAGAAGQADGEAPHRGGDRRRAARRRHGDGLRAAGPRVRLHGRRRHGAAGAERGPHAAAGRDRAPRRRRQQDAERRHQRSHARLGHQRQPTRITSWGRCWARIRIR